MALNDIGVSFLDQNGERKRRPDGSDNRLGGAVQMLALQLPRILGTQALAPSELIQSLGSGGPAGLAPVTEVGPRGGIVDAIANEVISSVTRSGAPGVGTDLMTSLTPPPPPVLPLPPHGPEGPYSLPPILPSPPQPTPPVSRPTPPPPAQPQPRPLPVPPPTGAPPPNVGFPSPTPSPVPPPVESAPAESIEEILSRVRGYKDFMFGNG